MPLPSGALDPSGRHIRRPRCRVRNRRHHLLEAGPALGRGTAAVLQALDKRLTAKPPSRSITVAPKASTIQMRREMVRRGLLSNTWRGAGPKMPGIKRKSREDRFAGYLVQASDDECWGWIGPVTNRGHLTLGRGGKGRAGGLRCQAWGIRHLSRSGSVGFRSTGLVATRLIGATGPVTCRLCTPFTGLLACRGIRHCVVVIVVFALRGTVRLPPTGFDRFFRWVCGD